MPTDINAREIRAAKSIIGLPRGAVDRCVAAALQFIRRRDRLENPPGSFDDAGRFWADEPTCCRTPSPAYPYSQMADCRTLAHCAKMHGADAEVSRLMAAFFDALEITDDQGEITGIIDIIVARSEAIARAAAERAEAKARKEAAAAEKERLRLELEARAGAFVAIAEAEFHASVVNVDDLLPDAARAA